MVSQSVSMGAKIPLSSSIFCALPSKCTLPGRKAAHPNKVCNQLQHRPCPVRAVRVHAYVQVPSKAVTLTALSVQLKSCEFRCALPTALCLTAGIGSVRSFVFERSEDFDDIRHFTQEMDRQHQLRLETLRGDFKPGLETFLQKSKIKAIILGTRRSVSCTTIPYIGMHVPGLICFSDDA